MSNYYGYARSNYFKVKDKEQFKQLCSNLNVEMIEKDDKVGFICSEDDCGSLPSSVYDEINEDDVDIDLIDEISNHLVEGEVAVMMESGHEKLCYVTGYAVAVNWKGEEISISLNDIYEKAQKELGGENISRAEY